jgi:hypothetical protein
MSKRRNRKNAPNIPQETLERARQQIAQQQAADAGAADDAEEEEVVVAPAPKPVTKVDSPVRQASRKPRRREGLEGVRLGEKRINPNDPEAARQMLDNPTKVVTEAELRQQYGYVLADLRSMGLLAGALIVAMIILAQIL